MFVVLLKFSENKGRAGEFMDGHKDWLQRGFDEGVFLLSGSLLPGLGGAILADGIAPGALRARVDAVRRRKRGKRGNH
jgi:uncharacterized protein YciI